MATRQSTRTKLLDAADHLFFSNGIADTPVDAILERSGVSPATLYRAYPSKEALLAAALVRRHEAWLTAWDEAVAHAPDDRGRLLAVFDALASFGSRPDGARWCAFLGTASEYADPPPEVAAALILETTSLRDRLHGLALPVAGDDAPAVADAVVLLVSGQLAMRLRGDTRTAARVARGLAEAVVDRSAASSG